MTRRIRYRPQAESDIKELFQFLDARNPAAAEQLLDDLKARLADLAEGPASAPEQRYSDEPDLTGIHVSRVSATFRRYLIFYRYTPDRITVLRLLYGSRHIPHLLLDDDY